MANGPNIVQMLLVFISNVASDYTYGVARTGGALPKRWIIRSIDVAEAGVNDLLARTI